MTGFYKTYYDILETIEYCVKKDRIIPSLILLYSAIDSISWVSNQDEKKGREVFKNWVKKWMLDKYPLPCNDNDIYAARCALLHTQTSDSDLSKDKKARKLFYSHGNSPIEPLSFAIDSIKELNENTVAVRLEDLINSFKQGMSDCLNEIEKDKKWNTIFKERADKYFALIK